MEIKEINQFVDQEIKRLEEYYHLKEGEELTLAMAMKIVEELGELFNEVLAHKGYQRKDKLNNLNEKEIEKEFADVIFTTIILSRRFNIDIEKALITKMNEIKNRNYKEQK